MRCLVGFDSLVENGVKGRLGLGLPMVLGRRAIDLNDFFKSMTHLCKAFTNFSDNY